MGGAGAAPEPEAPSTSVDDSVVRFRRPRKPRAQAVPVEQPFRLNQTDRGVRATSLAALVLYWTGIRCPEGPGVDRNRRRHRSDAVLPSLNKRFLQLKTSRIIARAHFLRTVLAVWVANIGSSDPAVVALTIAPAQNDPVVPHWIQTASFSAAYEYLNDVYSRRNYRLFNTALNLPLDSEGHLALQVAYQYGNIEETGAEE
jgi:hypothetical protein